MTSFLAELLRDFSNSGRSRKYPHMRLGPVFVHQLRDMKCRTARLVGGPLHGDSRVILIEPPSTAFLVPLEAYPRVRPCVAVYRWRERGYYAFEGIR